MNKKIIMLLLLSLLLSSCRANDAEVVTQSSIETEVITEVVTSKIEIKTEESTKPIASNISAGTSQATTVAIKTQEVATKSVTTDTNSFYPGETFIGIAGDEINISDGKRLSDVFVEYNSFTYIREATGIFYEFGDENWRDDYNKWIFDYFDYEYNWKKITIGDKVGNLTVCGNYTVYCLFQNKIITQIRRCDFEGEITLTGVMQYFPIEKQPGMVYQSGELIFHPYPQSCVDENFPMIIDIHIAKGIMDLDNPDSKLQFIGDSDGIYLGHPEEYGIEEYFCDENYIKVEATIDNISLIHQLDSSYEISNSTARLIDVNIID